ncbi:MAG TPA: 50S ribosomal protein L20 [Coprothermobacter proteolyticus]|uniref:Large ribosomal subunit protein bL20 n=1 Tax=Coprothermobacter proteolyticus (strain ATCC 35245 / DSM 5265 / OCM 4 / BT) TaxID=309798 RepID=B5Y858_COPPD|nr:50S ribosomal protein L20 [Coprothermobacter proteolyticus]MBK6585765.1 50S ribosomal protein L20 [Coprothermobacter sp.]ACI16930.1 50S ribosomal protein L20 [Coprothermobacter proteolyticus DSM 5265]MBP8984101.1 50S ribosomal protein L20 [Coprothermobacter sp.]NLT83359.1 50S ribosomal protein L20 [Coprothermobacter proteolyticus]HOA64232.1 50S ribosomal protein L20 [Coprothermobacter proteolyticus]
MRVKTSVAKRARHKKVLKEAKGYFGASHRVYRKAHEAVLKAGEDAFAGRKQRKRDMRSLWITRINAAARNHGMNYSNFMHGLKVAGIQIDRKMLAELAVTDPEGFSALVEKAKEAVG